MKTLVDTLTEPDVEQDRGKDDLERVAHLVMKGEWPRALCGHVVKDLFNRTAPAMDRCTACLKIARERGLRLTGWSGSA